MQLTDHQKNLITAHYGPYDTAAMNHIETDLAAGNYDIDFEGIALEHPEVTA